MHVTSPFPRSTFDILIVEDEPISRQALTSLMKAHGYQTQSVGSGEDALLKLTTWGSPRYALVDLDLPGMDGFDFIRQLHAVSSTAIPVLITAAPNERVAAFRRRHRVLYMQKPVDFDRLLSTLNEIDMAN